MQLVTDPEIEKTLLSLPGYLTHTNYEKISVYFKFHGNLKYIAKYIIYLLSIQWIFTKTYHIQSHKTNLMIFKRTKIIPSMFAEHNGIKLKLLTERYI